MVVTGEVAWSALVNLGRPSMVRWPSMSAFNLPIFFSCCSMKYVTIWANVWWTACGTRFSFVSARPGYTATLHPIERSKYIFSLFLPFWCICWCQFSVLWCLCLTLRLITPSSGSFCVFLFVASHNFCGNWLFCHSPILFVLEGRWSCCVSSAGCEQVHWRRRSDMVDRSGDGSIANLRFGGVQVSLRYR
jgi:hypothetical protein